MRKWPLAIALVWATLIFATSCTVIGTDELYSLIGYIFGPNALQRFEVFWGVAWFTVVKGWHVTEFAILTAVFSATLHAWRPQQRQRNILTAALLALLFAASDEYHQTFVPTRGGTIWDVLIDSLGVGLVTLYSLSRLRRFPTAEPLGQSVGPATNESNLM